MLSLEAAELPSQSVGVQLPKAPCVLVDAARADVPAHVAVEVFNLEFGARNMLMLEFEADVSLNTSSDQSSASKEHTKISCQWRLSPAAASTPPCNERLHSYTEELKR